MRAAWLRRALRHACSVRPGAATPASHLVSQADFIRLHVPLLFGVFVQHRNGGRVAAVWGADRTSAAGWAAAALCLPARAAVHMVDAGSSAVSSPGIRPCPRREQGPPFGRQRGQAG